MDEYSNRRTVNRHPDTRGVSDLVSKRTPRSMSQAAQLGNQLGCGNRSNKVKIFCSENFSTSKRSDNKRAIVGSSLSSSSTNSSTRCLWQPQRKVTPKVEKFLPQSASSSGNLEGGIGHGSGVTENIHLLNHDAGYPSTDEFVLNAVYSRSARAGNNVTEKTRLEGLAGSGSSSSKSKISQTTIPSLSHSSGKHSSKSLKCNSLVETKYHERIELLKKGNFEGESSSSGVKKTSKLKIGEGSGSTRGKSTGKLRKQMYWSEWDKDKDNAIRTQKPAFPFGRAKPSTRECGNNSALNEMKTTIQGQVIYGQEVSITSSASSMLDTNSSENSITHQLTSGSSTISSGSSVATGSANQGVFPHMDSITEVLLALEHTGHEERLSYERLLFLEMNSYLSGLGFHDQHRDMRLDIDHMSYEELLALEDRIGCVSTAITGEAMDRCINKSFYKPAPSEIASIGIKKEEDDLKCSICQEEYDIADELGRLHCEHLYHLCCIQQWLNQKNWCPICKSSVVPS